MNSPAISVILPAYNCEKYIGKAIQSVLQQTFTDFELIIINDGSTDKTETSIRQFTDQRIIYLQNPGNKGLVYTLNRSIELAKGTYIARMDSDDISVLERLAKQKGYLDTHPETTMLATTINFIDANGNDKGIWALDRKMISPALIRNKMPFENCIAHPSIMIRADILKKLKYNPRQVNIEDYDLWLRLLNRGYVIDKINEPLLWYRIHDDSITHVHLKKKNFFFKHLSMKRKFLAKEILSGRVNGFTLKVIVSTIVDFLKGTGKEVKKIVGK
jgi:glycosyltransferase involved in cell wall biosynthesis